MLCSLLIFTAVVSYACKKFLILGLLPGLSSYLSPIIFSLSPSLVSPSFSYLSLMYSPLSLSPIFSLSFIYLSFPFSLLSSLSLVFLSYISSLSLSPFLPSFWYHDLSFFLSTPLCLFLLFISAIPSFHLSFSLSLSVSSTFPLPHADSNEH